MRRSDFFAAVLVLAVLPGHSQVQSPTPRAGAPSVQQAGTGTISGTVQAADNGRPARRARVSLIGGDPRVAHTMTTTDSGGFSFSGLPPGEFTLSVTKPGWLDSIFGQKHAGSGRPGTPIALAAGQRLENVALPLARGGVLTGVVLDEQGDPAFGTPVRAMRYIMRNGERQLASAGSATSDDRGVYRIPGLLAGEYIVAAVPREADGPLAEEKSRMEEVAAVKMEAAKSAAGDLAQAKQDIQKLLDSMSASSDPAKAPTSGYAPVYYPGTTTGASATIIPLGISEEKPGLDIQLQIVPLSSVTGILVGPDGSAPAGAQVLLIDSGQGLPGTSSRSARVGSDGRFTFAGVQQGSYTLVARGSVASALPQLMSTMSITGVEEKLAMARAAQTSPGNQLWAIADVTADARNTAPLVLSMQPGMSVSGTLNFDGAAAPADLSRVRLALTPLGPGADADLGGSLRPVGLDADRRFTFTGVAPGRYRVSLASSTGLGGWSMKSAMAGGQDTLDLPLDIKPNASVTGVTVTMTTHPTDLRGMLQGPTGQPAPDYTVIVFSSDNRFWTPQSRRVQAARPATDGRFSFHDLPAGDYRLAAVADVEPGLWFSPAFLRQLIGASTTVTLTEGDRKTQDLKIASSKF